MDYRMCFNDFICSAEQRYVCEYDSLSPDVSVEHLANIDDCPTDFQFFFGNCYLLSSAKTDWTSAKLYCESKNSYLMVVNNHVEFSLLQFFWDQNFGENFFVITILLNYLEI